MRVPCSKCNAVTTIHSRPKEVEGRDKDGVYWRVYGVCPTCGTTSVYNWHGRAVHSPDDWQPHQAATENKAIEQVEMQLVTTGR